MKRNNLAQKYEEESTDKKELQNCSEPKIKQYFQNKETDLNHLELQLDGEKEYDDDRENSNNEDSDCTTSRQSRNSNDMRMDSDRYGEISEQRSRHKIYSMESHSIKKNNNYLGNSNDKKFNDKNVNQSINKLSYEIQKQLHSIFTNKDSISEPVMTLPPKSLFATSSEEYDLSESQSTSGTKETEFFKFRNF